MPAIPFTTIIEVRDYVRNPDVFTCKTTLLGGRKVYKRDGSEKDAISLNLLIRSLEHFTPTTFQEKIWVNEAVDAIRTIDRTTEEHLQNEILHHSPIRRLLTRIKRFLTCSAQKREQALVRMHQDVPVIPVPQPRQKVSKASTLSPSRSPSTMMSLQRTPSKRLNALELYKNNPDALSKIQKTILFRNIASITPTLAMDALSSVEGFLRQVSDNLEEELDLNHPNCLRALEDIYLELTEETRIQCNDWIVQQATFSPEVLVTLLSTYSKRSAKGESFPLASLKYLLEEYKRRHYDGWKFTTEQKKAIDMAFNTAIFLYHSLLDPLIEWMIDSDLITLNSFNVMIRAYIRKAKSLPRGVVVDNWTGQKLLIDLYKQNWEGLQLPDDVEKYLKQAGAIAD
jgi:hypothetical protein